MLSIVKSMVMIGIDGQLVSVQVDVSSGLPYFEIVGLPDATVRESKERVRVAIKNSGYEFFSKRIIINLAPANIKKVGAMFDLPIAIGILCSMGVINVSKMKDFVIVGELSLDGRIKKVREVLAICIEIRKTDIKNIIIPKENYEDIKFLNGINIYLASNLKDVINFFDEGTGLEVVKTEQYEGIIDEEFGNIDFSDVYGQETAKRALEIAAAGGHNCLMSGVPR